MRAFFKAPGAPILVAILIGLGALGWLSGGFGRLIPDFRRLVDGPLPTVSSIFRWELADWGSLCSIASIELLTLICLGETRKWHRKSQEFGFDSAVFVGLNIAIATAMIVLSLVVRNWMLLATPLAAIPAGISLLGITATWLLASGMMAQREGALPNLQTFPLRSLGWPARFVAGVVFRGYLLASYGMFAVLLYELGMLTIRYGISAWELRATSVSSAS